MSNKRLDILLVSRGLARSRAEAKEWIQNGDVWINGVPAVKPAQELPEDVQIDLRAARMPYVSRGGLKLEKALHVFPITLTGCTALDIGASTGGFTDCMLRAGASRVFAVDVGSDQLAEPLRADPRVVNLEKTNIRALTAEQVPEVDFFTSDVSFISLTLVLPIAYRFLRPEGGGVCLIKPQFEVGRGRVGKKGVVRDPALHREVLEHITGFANSMGFAVRGLDFSPIRGPEGNIEYLMYLRKCDLPPYAADIPELVRAAHRAFSAGAGGSRPE